MWYSVYIWFACTLGWAFIRYQHWLPWHCEPDWHLQEYGVSQTCVSFSRKLEDFVECIADNIFPSEADSNKKRHCLRALNELVATQPQKLPNWLPVGMFDPKKCDGENFLCYWIELSVSYCFGMVAVWLSICATALCLHCVLPTVSRWKVGIHDQNTLQHRGMNDVQ